jgi:hypothetical protein
MKLNYFLLITAIGSILRCLAEYRKHEVKEELLRQIREQMAGN